MVKANRIGLTVVDATTAMEGQGPNMGEGARLVKMNLVIASTNALAADMVAASTMGFDTSEDLSGGATALRTSYGCSPSTENGAEGS